MLHVKLSALLLILTASLPGVCIPILQMRKWGPRGMNGWLWKQWWTEYSNLESVSTTPEGGWEKVLFLDMPESLCGCWWPTLIPGKTESFVRMRATVDYETRNSVSGTRSVTGLRVQGQKAWIWWWVTVKALSPGVELNIKLGTLCVNQWGYQPPSPFLNFWGRTSLISIWHL